MKAPSLTDLSGESETSANDQVIQEIIDAISSNDKTVEIRPAEKSGGMGLTRLLLVVAGAVGIAYWMRNSQKPDELLKTAKEETSRMSEQAAETIEEGSETASDRIEAKAGKASEAVEGASSTVEEAGETAAERTEKVGETAAERTEEAGETVGDDSSDDSDSTFAGSKDDSDDDERDSAFSGN